MEYCEGGGWGRGILCLDTLVAATHQHPPVCTHTVLKASFYIWEGQTGYCEEVGPGWGGGYFAWVLWWLLHMKIPLVYSQNLENINFYFWDGGGYCDGVGWEGGTLFRYFGGCYTSTSPLYTHRDWKVSIYIWEGRTGYCEGVGPGWGRVILYLGTLMAAAHQHPPWCTHRAWKV